MIEIYYWEDDDEAEEVFKTLKDRGLEYKAHLLDAEEPNARPSITVEGKTYWEFSTFLKSLEA